MSERISAQLFLFPLLTVLVLLLAGTARAGDPINLESAPEEVELFSGESWQELSFVGNLLISHQLANLSGSESRVVGYFVEHRSGERMVRLSPLESDREGEGSNYWLVTPEFGVLVDTGRERYFINNQRLWLEKLRQALDSLSSADRDNLELRDGQRFLQRPVSRVSGPGWSLVIDSRTGVPLRWQGSPSSSRRDYFEFSSFAEVRNSEVPPERFRIPADFEMIDLRGLPEREEGEAETSLRATSSAGSKAPFLPLVPAEPPASWVLHDLRIESVRQDGRRLAFFHMQMVDEADAAFVSIFQFPSPTLTSEMRERLTPEESDRTVLTVSRDGVDLLLVGGIPEARLHEVADSLVNDSDLAEMLLSLVPDIDVRE